MTWSGYLPLIPSVYDTLKPYILYPSMIGTYSVRPLPFKLGNAPSVGQGLYIALFLTLVVVFTAIDYELRQPHARFMGERREIGRAHV